MSEEEIKALLKRNLELAEDTNRILHGMRRRAFLGTLFTVFLWLAFVIIPAAAFYYYAAPYIGQMQNLIKSTEALQSQLKGAESSSFFQDLYNKYMSSSTK
jgi:hypothetical protein